MTDAKNKKLSLHAFIEQTARMLRDATKSAKKKNRKYRKETGLSNRNKIEQIAFLIRSQAKKRKSRKKKFD